VLAEAWPFVAGGEGPQEFGPGQLVGLERRGEPFGELQALLAGRVVGDVGGRGAEGVLGFVAAAARLEHAQDAQHEHVAAERVDGVRGLAEVRQPRGHERQPVTGGDAEAVGELQLQPAADALARHEHGLGGERRQRSVRQIGAERFERFFEPVTRDDAETHAADATGPHARLHVAQWPQQPPSPGAWSCRPGAVGSGVNVASDASGDGPCAWWWW
jgi:hypothetical protein